MEGGAGATYRVVYSGGFSISDHTGERDVPSRRPERLVVKVRLPSDAVPAQELDLEVEAAAMKLGATGDPPGEPRYLDISLPYPVKTEAQNSAKLMPPDEDGRRMLEITLPVAQPKPSLAMPPPLPPQESEEAKGVGCDEAGESVDHSQVAKKKHEKDEKEEGKEKGKETEREREREEQQDSSCGGSGKGTGRQGRAKEAYHSRWVSPPQEGEKFNFNKQQDLEAGAGATGENKSLAETTALAQEKVTIQGDFTPASHFLGEQPNYLFKKGDKGLGYYRNAANESFAKEVPLITWRQNEKTVTGRVSVKGVASETVSLSFSGQKMTLTFEANDEGGQGTGSAGERSAYSVELSLPGGVNEDLCRHDVSDMNMVLIIYKAGDSAPYEEWETMPSVISRASSGGTTKSAELMSKDQQQPSSPPPVDQAPKDLGNSPEGGSSSAGLGLGKAPGHGGVGGTCGFLGNTLAFELD
ncbi:unnamed protein product [Discosporangium mesarthrocarpum]